MLKWYEVRDFAKQGVRDFAKLVLYIGTDVVYSFHVLLFIFMGHMEYARLVIISSSVGDLFQSWLFHLKISITEILL